MQFEGPVNNDPLLSGSYIFDLISVINLNKNKIARILYYSNLQLRSDQNLAFLSSVPPP